MLHRVWGWAITTFTSGSTYAALATLFHYLPVFPGQTFAIVGSIGLGIVLSEGRRRP